MYKNNKGFYELQFNPKGFEWVDLNHREESVVAYMRKGKNRKDDLLVVLNMTPIVRKDWKLQVKGGGKWVEAFNSNEKKYFGTGDVYNLIVECKLLLKNKRLYEINVQIPALAGIVLKRLE